MILSSPRTEKKNAKLKLNNTFMKKEVMMSIWKYAIFKSLLLANKTPESWLWRFSFQFHEFLCIVKVFHFAIFLFQFDDWNDWNSFLKSRKTFGGFKKLWNGRFLIKNREIELKIRQKISFNHFDGFFLLA